MPYGKSDMRAGAEQRVEGARARLDGVLRATPGGEVMAEALRTNDHRTAQAEAKRLGGEVREAWTGLDEAIKFLAFSLLTDVADGPVDPGPGEGSPSGP
jgi:hypothetical protein